MDRDVTETILDACDIDTKTGIRNLIDRSLLRIQWDNELAMHPLIQTMGRDLVRQESPLEPRKRSRLWCSDESFKLLKQKKGKGCLLGLALDMRMLDKKKSPGSLELKTESFSGMDNLMLLQLNYVQLNGCFKRFPEELRWLCMHGSPLKSIPLDLPTDNLVALDMSYSNIESFDMSGSNPQPPAKRQKGLIGSSSKNKRLLGSLKILDLSFCEKLQSVGGFSELPALERLIVRNCISLIEVCELLEQSAELVHIDLSYCYSLRKLPKSIHKLRKVKTILLDGCNSRESEIEMGNVKDIPSDLKFFMISLPSSLRTLSLEGNNLSNESFPMDFSCLSMLKELFLGWNPIVSMPGCVRTLPRLEKLDMNECSMMISIENPPCTLRELVVRVIGVSKPVLRKIKFDPEMSPLILHGSLGCLSLDIEVDDIEVDGMVKIQGMASVEEKALHSLGWTDLDFIKEMRFFFCDWIGNKVSTEYQTQMFYEFGIFSTFFAGNEMPDWIRCRSMESSISFTIPSSPKKFRGLNFFCVEASVYRTRYRMPLIKISNITKEQTWIYKHYVEWVDEYEDYSEDGEEKHICLLSHWMFGPNEMKVGDHITITLGGELRHLFRTKECGIEIVYEDDDEKIEEEDALGYYKSWNHIIGGDLSAFQLTTGEYALANYEFRRFFASTSDYFPFTDGSARYKERRVMFKAFSGKKKSDEDAQVPCDVGNVIQLVG